MSQSWVRRYFRITEPNRSLPLSTQGVHRRHSRSRAVHGEKEYGHSNSRRRDRDLIARLPTDQTIPPLATSVQRVLDKIHIANHKSLWLKVCLPAGRAQSQLLLYPIFSMQS